MTSNSQVLMNSYAGILGAVRKKGVRLWSKNGELHYRGPKGALTQEEIEILRVSRGEIVALLESTIAAETAEPRLEHRPRLGHAPLTFSQLAYMHYFDLHGPQYERHSVRLVWSAMCLRGRLNVSAFRQSVAEIIRRHDALRTRISYYDGIPTQKIVESDDCELEVEDLTALSEHSREIEVVRIFEQFILEPIDVSVDSLFGIRLLRLSDNEHVLILAMEHMISDGTSLYILGRDLLTAYMHALRGRPISLPEIQMQFADYAVWQRSTQKSWIEKHGPYWSERLAGCQRLRFPEDRISSTEAHLGMGSVPLRIGRSLKKELQEWCRLRHTTAVMTVFTAYVALVLRWCNASESVIQYLSNGRVSPKVENTVGFFASALYLRIQLLEDDSFVDLMSRVTEEYCRAFEHADFSYVTAQVPRPECSANTSFNWTPRGTSIDLSDFDGADDAIRCSQVRFVSPTLRVLNLDCEPAIQLYDADEEIAGSVFFSRDRFSIDTMERFGRNFLMLIRTLLRQPEGRVKDILLL